MTAENAAADNDATVQDCWFITGLKDSTGAIQKSAIDPTCDVGDSVPPDANGVQVRTAQTRAVTFKGLGGLGNSTTARATAAASVQKLARSGSPFVVCGSPDPALAKGKPPGYNILKTVSTGVDAIDFIRNPDGTVDVDPIKAAALNSLNGGQGIPLQGSETRVTRCGVGANFDGKGTGASVSLPAWVGYTNGGGYDDSSNEQILTANPCPNPFPAGGAEVQCDILLPIADTGGTPGHSDELHVVAVGVFHVTGDGHGNPKYFGRYVADARQVSGGITTTGPITAGTIRVINLIE